MRPDRSAIASQVVLAACTLHRCQQAIDHCSHRRSSMTAVTAVKAVTGTATNCVRPCTNAVVGLIRKRVGFAGAFSGARPRPGTLSTCCGSSIGNQFNQTSQLSTTILSEPIVMSSRRQCSTAVPVCLAPRTLLSRNSIHTFPSGISGTNDKPRPSTDLPRSMRKGCLPERRHMSSWADIVPAVPEFAKQWTIWGGSGFILKTIHHGGTVPYWACMAVTNVVVRTSLIPLVIQSAHTSIRFAKVAPEVQFLLTLFQKDMKNLKEKNASPVEQFALMRATMQTLGGLYKLNNVHPLAVFKSPLLQLPIYWYFSIDIRKIINGADPELAQKLTEGGFLWFPDLTEPDPWYGLPILGGLLLYMNVEVALGKRILSGEATSKANAAKMMKDFFQSLAVFMPCFMAHQPAGIQIYLTTSFVFTMAQAAALRNDGVRAALSLPKSNSTPTEAPTASEFIKLKKFERDAREARGESGEVLGSGVLAPGYEGSATGTTRPSTIKGNGGSTKIMQSSHPQGYSVDDIVNFERMWSPSTQVPMAPSPSESSTGIEERVSDDGNSNNDTSMKNDKEGEQVFMAGVSDADIEAANNGQGPKAFDFVELDKPRNGPLKLTNLMKKKNRPGKQGKGRKKRK